MNILNIIINILSELYISKTEFYARIIKSLIDGIAFISNMENVLMGEIFSNKNYLMEDIKDINNNIIIKKKNENFKILINNYIIKEYFVFNNWSDTKLFEQYEIFMLNLEIILIGSQKLFYEYINYVNHLYNWYGNFKILINKNIINLNIREELYYNIILELLSDIQIEHNKSLWWSIQNTEDLKKEYWLRIFKNYFKLFKENPYKINIELINLYKKYSRTNLLTYGLNYDINILTNNKYILSFFDINILNKNHSINTSNNIITNIDKNQFLYQNMSIWKPKFKKESFNTMDANLNKFVLKFAKRFEKSKIYMYKTYTRFWLRWFNNRFFNFQFLKGSALVFDWNKYDIKLNIPYFPKIIFNNWSNIKFKGFYYWQWKHPEYYWVSWIQWIIERVFVGKSMHDTVIKEQVHDIIITDKKKIKLFGGYTYWWIWHNRDTGLLLEKNWFGRKTNKLDLGWWGIRYKTIGLHHLYYKTPYMIELNVDWDRVVDQINHRGGYVKPEMSNAEINNIITTQDVKKVKKLDEAPQIDLNIIKEEPVMEDTSFEEIVANKSKKGKKKSKLNILTYTRGNFLRDEYNEALKLEKKNKELDPLGISNTLKRKYRYHYAYSVPYMKSYLIEDKELPKMTTKKKIRGKYATRFRHFNILWNFRPGKNYYGYNLHGLKTWKINKIYFKTFLWANDVWLQKKVISITDYIKGVKNKNKIFRKHFYIKNLSHFIDIRLASEYMDSYVKHMINAQKKALKKMDTYWFSSKENEIKYLKESHDLWSKKFKFKLKELLGKDWKGTPYIRHGSRSLVKILNLKNIEKEIKLGLITMKFNTPMNIKRVPLKYIRMWGHGKNAETYYVLYKWFNYFFYPETSKKLKKIRFKTNYIDLLINLGEKGKFKKSILNNINEIKKEDLKLKINAIDKFTMYKTIMKKNFMLKYYRTKNMSKWAMSGIRGLLIFQYNFDNFINTNNLASIYYIRKSPITWDTFYINIEGVSEPLNLNIIHKNFYGTHIDKNSYNNFLFRKSELINNINLPKSTNILLKKAYIENLIYVYEKENKPVFNYILYNLQLEQLKFLHKLIYKIIDILISIINRKFSDLIDLYRFIAIFIKDLILQKLLKFREVRTLKRHFETYYEFYKYLLYIMIIIFVYIVVSYILILLLKSFIPKNLIYGIKLFNNKLNKNNTENINNYNFIEHFDKQLYEIENLIEIDRKIIYKNILKNIDKINDITVENLKKLELQVNLNKEIKKNFFDAEHRFIYSWNDIHSTNESIKNLKKIRIYNTLEKKKKEDLKKNYIIFYKNFLFEKNLEKWENNTKMRLDLLLWLKDYKIFINMLIKALWLFFKDKRYNYNRMLFWDDPSLDENNTITYMYAVPKPFANFFFIIRFIIGSIKLWDYSYWVSKWKQYVIYGVHSRINYKELKERLEKEISLEWYREEADFGATMYFKDFMKVAQKYRDLKKAPTDQEILNKKIKRRNLLSKVLNLVLEEDKVKEIQDYLIDLKNLELDRINGSFNEKFENIKIKLILDINKISPKKWAEQELRYKYINEVYKKKLEIEKNEYEILKQSYTTRMKRDREDKHKTLQTLEWGEEKKVKILMQKKLETVKYEKNLREYNYNHKFIDESLDAKDKIFYESIKKYNEELSDKYLEIEEIEKEEKLNDTLFENKSRKLYGILDQNYIWFRWFTTMGARINYIIVIIVGIFVGWLDNMKKIRKNEYNILNIFRIMWIDGLKYIYKIYWEYLILWNKNKILKKLGFSIKEIFKFSIILTPLIIYSTILYSILILYLVLIIILWIFPKKIYKKIKENILWLINKKIIQNIIKLLNILLNYIKYIVKIINLIFKDLKTGNTLLDQLYNNLYKYCGIIQYNIYMIKGSFILGYTEKKNIKDGLYSIKKLFILKYNAYKEKKYNNKKKIILRIIEIKENLFIKIYLIKYYFKIRSVFIKFYLKCLNYIYTKIIYSIFKIERKTFYDLYIKNTRLYVKYYMELKNKLDTLLMIKKKIKLKDFFKLMFQIIWKILILPITFIINHQKYKYIKNYKKGIQGFRENPMYLLLDNPKEKKDWKVKWHNILMEHKISRYLENLLDRHDTLIEMFFMFKISEVKWTNKNYYQDFFWRRWYWQLKRYKKKIITFLVDIMTKIEDSYISFEENIETQNWTILERCKYAYYTYSMYNHAMTRKSQKRKSRDIFFYKRIKDRKKLILIYFIKGLINWITYITVNKIIFVKVQNIKIKKNYKIKKINANIHITEYIEEIPPQFWSLILIYDKYYKYLLRYKYENGMYPKKWEENKELEFKKNYKWRLGSPKHNTEIPFYDRRFIAADLNSFHFTEFVACLSNEPYDPMLKWMIFILEYGMTEENIMTPEEMIVHGNQVWMDKITLDDNVWGDISLTHLLTYNVRLDEYKYEIKDFNRLIKGIDFLNVAENTLERDKLKHYEDRFKLVANTIMMENEGILGSILKERKLESAKMLHKALIRNRLKTKLELDEEKEEQNKKEYFYVKKRQFFEDLLIEEYWDWQAQYDEGVVEDKYFNSKDLWNKTYDAQLHETYYMDIAVLEQYDYLLNHIVLKSFDQTMEEIHYFLTFKVWSILEKKLKKNKKKIEINYKNLEISSKVLSRINYKEHWELKFNSTYDKKKKKDIIEKHYEFKYKGLELEWESTQTEAIYGFIENNILGSYFEIGQNYTYEDKIQYNEEALRYRKPSKLFHGQEYIIRWRNVIAKRKKSLKNIKKKYIKKEISLPLNLAYINNIKWSWEQWLIYSDIEEEDEIFNKNIIILNERFRLWNLKRVPIRIKLPIELDVDFDYIKSYFRDKSNYISFMDHRHIMMTRNISPLLKQSLIWWRCKAFLEKHFNKSIEDLILWLFTAEVFNREVIKIKEDYHFVLKNFTKNFGVFHKLYFLGMPEYTWDLIRYHEVWWGEEEFPYDKYYQLKQIEFLNHDPAARKIVRKLYKIYIDKFSPMSYVFFFKYQFFANYLYNIYGILSISSFFWMIKVLLYNPGEYISENYILFVPMLLTLAFWYLRRSLRDVRDISQGSEIYLYRYHTSKTMDMNKWFQLKTQIDNAKKEWILHFYDADKIKEVFGPDGEHSIDTQRDPEWWRYHTHRIKTSKIYTHEHIRWWMWLFVAYHTVEYWKFYQFKYRNKPWIWDYYRYNEELYKKLISKGIAAPRSYKERLWLEDSWSRLENGGNSYSRWYENFYRKNWGLKYKPLDYGYNFQKIQNAHAKVEYEDKIYHFSCAYADVNWFNLSHYIDYYNKLPSKFKDFTKELKEFKERKKTKVGYKERKRTESKFKELFDDIEIKKIQTKLDNWEILKEGFRDAKRELKDLIKKYYLGDSYIHRKHPLKKWADFLNWVFERNNYDITQHVYTTFLIEAREQTKALIKKDIYRYIIRHDNKIETYLNDINIFKRKFKDIKISINKQTYLRDTEVILMKKKSWSSGTPLELRALLTIKEQEKHNIIFCYNFEKYKQHRWLRDMFTRNKFYMSREKIKEYQEEYAVVMAQRDGLISYLEHWRSMVKGLFWGKPEKYVQKLIDEAQEPMRKRQIDYYFDKHNDFLRRMWRYRAKKQRLLKHEKYIQNINKETKLEDITEYRYNLITEYLKEKKNIWIFIQDFFEGFNMFEIFSLLLKIIYKIFE